MIKNLVIPTYKRPLQLAKMVGKYVNHFKKFGHVVRFFVFDESPGSFRKKACCQLKNMVGKMPIYYVGEKEKNQLFELIKKNTSNQKILAVSQNLLFGSRRFGSRNGHRNLALLYLLGEQFLSIDDDISPYSFNLKKKSQLGKGEISRGIFLPENEALIKGEIKEVDLLSGYNHFLGKKVCQFSGVKKGRVAYSIEAKTAQVMRNSTQGNYEPDRIYLSPIKMNKNAKIKLVMSHLSGDADLDAEDLLVDFLTSGDKKLLFGEENLKYLISGCDYAITHGNWRLTAALLAFDDTEGFAPFIPTWLRCGDFGLRVFIAKTKKMAMAYTNFALAHDQSIEGRGNLLKDYANELKAILLKKKIKESVVGLNDWTIKLKPKIKFTFSETNEIYQKVIGYQNEALKNLYHKQDTLNDFLKLLKKEFPYLYNKNSFCTDIEKDVSLEYARYYQFLNNWQALINLFFLLKEKYKLPVLEVRK